MNNSKDTNEISRDEIFFSDDSVARFEKVFEMAREQNYAYVCFSGVVYDVLSENFLFIIKAEKA